MFKKLFVTLLLFLSASVVAAQEKFHAPDKVYLQLDRNLYAQGDTIWIKGYAMERGTNKPSNNSYAIHVQMLNEDGAQVGAYKLLTIDGVATGQIELLGVQKPGFYQLIAHTGYMKNFSQRFFFKTTFEVREKVRRRTINALFDQVAYEAGDTAKVTFSVIDQNKTPVGGARFVFQYMQGDEKVMQNGVHCADDGMMTVKIPIIENKNKAKQFLHLNYYAEQTDAKRKVQEISIPIKNDKINLTFFPEGGDLIESLSSKVAFKAYDDKGNPINIKGNLYRNDELLSPLATVHHGMGMFTLLADTASYTFTITQPSGIDSIYQLPAAKKEGFVLSYLSQNKENLVLSVKQNYATPQDCKLWISYCDSLWAVHDCEINGECQLPLPKDNLPQGIVTFTLSDANGVPQAERLVYVQKEEPDLLLSLDQHVFSAKEKVDVNINLDTPHLANLSFAVVDSLLSNSPKLQTTSIKAYAQLGSELKGYIPHINQYLGRDRSIANKRDLLLLTHGWRRFEWIDNRESLSTMKVHDFNRVYGQVKRLGKPYPKAKIGAYMLGETIAATEFEADKDGRFFLDPAYKLRTYNNLMIIALNKNGKRSVSLFIQNTDTILFDAIGKNNSQGIARVLFEPIQLQEEQSPSVVEESFMLYNTQILKEFEVSAQRKDWDMSKYFSETSEQKLGEELEEFISFSWLLKQTSNRVYIEGEYFAGDSESLVPENRVLVKNSFNAPSYFYESDLIFIFNEDNPMGAMIYVNDKPWGYDLHALDFLRKDDVKAIAILDGAAGCEHFGSEAYYGAIMVYVHEEALTRAVMSRNQLMYGDFVKARQFVNPIYETQEQIKTVGDDNRITLHWEPLLETDEHGQAKVSFYTGDIPGKKQIIVQGFDDEGNLYYETASFMVKDILKR